MGDDMFGMMEVRVRMKGLAGIDVIMKTWSCHNEGTFDRLLLFDDN